MKKTDNKEMLNAIREQASTEYKERVATVDGVTIQPRAVLTAMTDYPTIKNEFINTLINKVVKTDFFSRVYTNPLKELKRGSLPYGATIEELFVMAADSKGFFDNTLDGGRGPKNFNDPNHTGLEMPDGAGELMKTERANIKKLYVTLNFAHVFKTSISDSQLAHAFDSANGLSDLVNQITSSLINGAEQKEFSDMKELLKAVAQQKQLITDGWGKIVPVTEGQGDASTSKIPLGYKSGSSPMDNNADFKIPGNKKKATGVIQSIYKVDVDYYKGGETNVNEGQALAMAVRSMAGRMKFVSDRFNMAGVPTFSNPEDLVLVTTPEIVAQMDVMVIANAFNVSSTDIKTKIILVDELPKEWYTGRELTTAVKDGVGYYYNDLNSDKTNTIKNISSTGKCLGMMFDKNFIQAIDTVNEARQFENGRALMTNLFLHRQGMLANCYFANCVAFFDGPAYADVKPRQHTSSSSASSEHYHP